LFCSLTTFLSFPPRSGPWNHVIACLAFGYVGSQYTKWEGQFLEQHNKDLVALGMKPLKGSSVWEWREQRKREESGNQ
jgi:hypothetical protein